MIKNVTMATMASCFVSSMVMAQDVTVNPVAEQVQNSAENATVQSYIAPVCQANIVLSSRAIEACNGSVDALPSMLKDGSRLSNRGVGAEFNTLVRNIDRFS